jgi:hypothetical protein
MNKGDFCQAAGLAGLGLAAGLTGALVMLLSQKAEAAITQREASATPSKAIEAVSGVDLLESDEQALATPVHLAFGTALGLGLAAMTKVPEPTRGGLFFAGAWGAGAALITGLGLSDPPTRWDAKKLAIDLGHHAVYAASAAAAFFGLRKLARL